MENLKYDLNDSYRNDIIIHPMAQMELLGINYKDATPQSINDSWQFLNCENIPNPLPSYLSIIDINPMELIGYGLSKEQAKQIIDNSNILKDALRDFLL